MCKQITIKGTQCKNPPVKGSQYCHLHIQTKKSSQFGGNGGNSINGHVIVNFGNFPINEELLSAIYVKFGPISKIEMSNTFATIYYKDARDAQDALKMLKKFSIVMTTTTNPQPFNWRTEEEEDEEAREGVIFHGAEDE